MSKALVVLSGGQDSTTCLFWAKKHFQEVHVITFDYNQRHRCEIEAAMKVASMAEVASHEVLQIGPILKGKSPLTNSNQELETYDDFASMAEIIGDRVELTFVPMRNLLFLTIAANRAACLGIDQLVIGVCAADNANYPDCRPKFVWAAMSAIGQALDQPRFFINAPVLHLSKSASIKLALSLPGCYAALGYSHTAYDGKYPPKGNDHASILRAHGFEEAGVPDPLVVRAALEGKMVLPETKNYDYVRPIIAIVGITEIEIGSFLKELEKYYKGQTK